MKYRESFDHLGQMKHGDYLPWTLADKVLLILLWVVIGALCLGVL